MMPLPYFVWLAHKTGRRLLLKYSRPHPLEEFLVPPEGEGGFDWRLPDEYCQKEWDAYADRSWTTYRNQRRLLWHTVIERPEWNDTRFVFVNSNLMQGAVFYFWRRCRPAGPAAPLSDSAGLTCAGRGPYEPSFQASRRLSSE